MLRPPTSLRAGTGRAIITPPVGFPMGGWSNAVHDRSIGNDMDLTATVLALADESTAAIVAELDLCLLTIPQARSMRHAIAEAINVPVESVRITTTHNHSAPVTGELTGAGWMFEGLEAVEPYVSMVAAHLVGAARAAWASLEPAWIGYGVGTSPLAVNRRASMPGGGIRVAHNPDGPVDHSVRVARLDGETGEPLATIVHYSAHPTILAGGNRYVTPDYPGVVRRTVERSMGGHCLFLQGTPGDVGTIETFVEDLQPYRRLGTMLGHDAAAVASRSTSRRWRQRIVESQDPSSWLARFEYEPETPRDATLRVATRTVPMPVRTDLGDPVALRREADGRRDDLRAALCRGADPMQIRELRVQTKGLCLSAERAEAVDGLDTYPLEIHGLRIGPLGFIGVPLEPFIEIGRAIAADSPFEQTFVSGYSNGWRGYLPTPEEWPRDGYEVDNCAFRPESANLLIEESLDLLADLAR